MGYQRIDHRGVWLAPTSRLIFQWYSWNNIKKISYKVRRDTLLMAWPNNYFLQAFSKSFNFKKTINFKLPFKSWTSNQFSSFGRNSTVEEKQSIVRTKRQRAEYEPLFTEAPIVRSRRIVTGRLSRARDGGRSRESVAR